jgi:hypothetical protein
MTSLQRAFIELERQRAGLGIAPDISAETVARVLTIVFGDMVLDVIERARHGR